MHSLPRLNPYTVGIDTTSQSKHTEAVIMVPMTRKVILSNVEARPYVSRLSEPSGKVKAPKSILSAPYYTTS